MRARLAALVTLYLLTIAAAAGPVQEDPAKEIPAFPRAHELRAAVWWVARVAMPQAIRPASTRPAPQGASTALDHSARVSLGSFFVRWLANAWSTIAEVVRLMLQDSSATDIGRDTPIPASARSTARTSAPHGRRRTPR